MDKMREKLTEIANTNTLVGITATDCQDCEYTTVGILENHQNDKRYFVIRNNPVLSSPPMGETNNLLAIFKVEEVKELSVMMRVCSSDD